MATTYPDVVSLLRTYLLPLVSPVPVVGGKVPDPRPARLVQLRRIGGQQQRPVRDQPRVDAIAWAATDVAAYALADTVRNAVHALAGTTLLGPAVYRVDEFLGPQQIDDPLTGTPRVMATYSLLIRADAAVR